MNARPQDVESGRYLVTLTDAELEALFLETFSVRVKAADVVCTKRSFRDLAHLYRDEFIHVRELGAVKGRPALVIENATSLPGAPVQVGKVFAVDLGEVRVWAFKGKN